MLPSIERMTNLSLEGFARTRAGTLFTPASPPFLASPLPRTHLSLERYAKIVGINPAHFHGGFTHTVYPIEGGCDDVWTRHSWQRADRVSREELSHSIKMAEDELSKFVGYPLCPSYTCDEHRIYRQFYRKDWWGSGMLDVTSHNKSVNAKKMKVIAPGRRGVREILLNTPASLADLDHDGFSETVAVAFTLTADEVALIGDIRELKVYFAGTKADQRWEIRYPKWEEVSVNGGLTSVTLTFDSWLFLKPDLQAQPTESGEASVPAIDMINPDVFVDTVDIYQEYIDQESPSAVFSWDSITFQQSASLPFSFTSCSTCNNTGCEACNAFLVNGCATVTNREAGMIVPVPAVYNTELERWQPTTLVGCKDPDRVAIWYVAGDLSDEFACGDARDPLSNFWAHTIAALASARLPRRICGCESASKKVADWQKDMSISSENEAINLDFAATTNPFGTRRGELFAYHRVSAFNVRKLDAVIVG